MAQTYTSDTLSVSNGEITSHDTTTVAEGITILSAECRWQGVETTEQETNYDYATNTNSDTATATTSTTTKSNTNNASNPSGASVDLPSPPSGYSFIEHTYSFSVSNSASVEQTASGTVYYPGGSQSFSQTLAAGESATVYSGSTQSNYVGKAVSIALESGGGRDNTTVSCSVSGTTVGEDTVVNYETATASYPSVPNGYSFDRHRYQEWSGSTEVADEYFYSNKVGQSVSAVSNDPNTTVEVQLETQGVDSNTYTVTHDTQDPFVTRDVDGSYTSSVDDGEWSSWVSLNGLATGVNEFYHNISGSGEAKFEFRYDWEYKYPDPVGGTLEYCDYNNPNTVYKVALADPSSPRLDYTVGEVELANGTYTIDMTEASASDAVPGMEFYHPTHGYLAPRYYDTDTV